MKRRLLALSVFLLAAPPRAAEAPKPAETVDMAEMMARAERYTKPGDAHKWLERFLGTWDTESRFMMGPSGPGKPEKGTSTVSWLMDGRWLKIEGAGSMMGMPVKTFYMVGYDNFKMSYVTAGVSTMDTALSTAEGDVDPRTGALVTYGTIDEYLTGEHDKMVKYVWRFPDADTMKLEVHDLPIGETDAKVLEITYRRRK